MQLAMLLPITTVLLGFLALLWSADRFVGAAAATAYRAGMSPMLIGMTSQRTGHRPHRRGHRHQPPRTGCLRGQCPKAPSRYRYRQRHWLQPLQLTGGIASAGPTCPWPDRLRRRGTRLPGHAGLDASHGHAAALVAARRPGSIARRPAGAGLSSLSDLAGYRRQRPALSLSRLLGPTYYRRTPPKA